MKLPALILILLTFVTFCPAQEVSMKDAEKAKQLLKEYHHDTIHVNALDTIGRYFIVKHGEQQEDLDSAIFYIDRAEKLSTKISYNPGIAYSYILYAMAFREKGDRSTGKEYAKKAAEFAKKNNLWTWLGEAYLELSNYFDHYKIDQGEDVEKIRFTRLAAKAFERAGNIRQEAFSLKNLGELVAISDTIPKAITTLKRSLSLYESIHYPRLHGVYDMLGVLYSHIGDHKSGVKYGLLAVNTAEQVGDTTSQLGTIYNRLGLTYYKLSDYTRAIEYLQKAYTVFEKYRDVGALYLIVSNLTKTYISLDRKNEALRLATETARKYTSTSNRDQLIINDLLLNVHTQMGNFPAAQRFADIVLKLVELPDMDNRMNHNAYAHVINFFLLSKQYAKAEQYLKIQRKMLEGDPAPFLLSRNYMQRFKLDSAMGNYRAAIIHYQNYKKIEDSVYNLDKTIQMETLALEYETAKKDQEIALKAQSIDLLTKQSQLQQNEIQRSAFIRNGTLAGIVLLIVIMGLLYTQYNTKKKSNQKLQHLLDEKEWLLKEVHHRVKNNLQTVLSLLESQSRQLSNEAMHAIQESQNRVYAMSLIHKKLYQSADVATINMEDYLRELIVHLQQSLVTQREVKFNLNLEPIELDVSQAVPIGLIVNEAITNSIKYAFPEKNGSNQITISMEHANNEIELRIADNGIGLPEPLQKKERSNSLGMKLMKGLTEDIEGKFSMESESGLMILVRFIANVPLQKLGAPSLQLVTERA